MVRLLQMDQLVEDDVVGNGLGHLDEPPVEADRARRRTGAPARSLIAHDDTLDRVPQLPCEHSHARRQLAGRNAAQVPHDRVARTLALACRHDLAAKAQATGAEGGFDGDALSAEPHRRPDSPCQVLPFGRSAQLGALRLDPGEIPEEKRLGFAA
jgi:hypothetical protein